MKMQNVEIPDETTTVYVHPKGLVGYAYTRALGVYQMLGCTWHFAFPLFFLQAVWIPREQNLSQ